MAIVARRLECALRLIADAGGECSRTGAFVDLAGDLLASLAVGAADARFDAVLRRLWNIDQDVRNVETLMDRLEWQRGLWRDGLLSDERWRLYAAADIDLFHVECRSAFDHAAVICCEVAAEQVKWTDNFGAIRKWAAEPAKAGERSNADKLGAEVAGLVLGADGFDTLTEVRNVTVHRGGLTLVFYDKPRILFQVHKEDMSRLVSLPEVMHNANVADFEKYGAVGYAYLISFLEELAEVAYGRLGLTRRSGGRVCNGGLRVAREWLERMVAPGE